MDIVLFHTGELPSFLEYTFRQIRLFNPDVNVYFLTDRRHYNNRLFKAYNVMPFDKDMFFTDKISQFEKLFNYGTTDFWTVTATRLIYIEKFIRDLELTDVYHFENDVLLYYDLKDFDKEFKFYENMAITVGGESGSMTGFMYIRHSGALPVMTQHFIDLLKTYGINGIINKYQIIMVNEMCLMRIFGRKYPKLLENLPTMPFGEMSENFEVFNSLFDPASWGQFVGGDAQKIPGCKPQDHYIGRMLAEHPEYSVIWAKDDKGRNIPYFEFESQRVKINNLHIHSKNLHLYMS